MITGRFACLTPTNRPLLIQLEQAEREKTMKRREAAKWEQLQNGKTVSSLTEEAAKDKRAKAKEVEGKQKEVMSHLRKLKSTPSRSEDTPAIKRSAKRKAGKETGVQGANATNIGLKKVPLEVGSKKSMNKDVRKKRAAAATVPQGERKVPEASDNHGCVHHGLLDLLALPKDYLRGYVREGEWLHGKPCKDCALKNSGCQDRVMDISSLLKVKGRGAVGYYCNCGPTGHKMDEVKEPIYKRQFECEMVLCMPCYLERQQTREGKGASKRIRKTRTKL
jgi:hypothetical protein